VSSFSIAKTVLQLKTIIAVLLECSSEDWLQHNLKPFQRAFNHVSQHTSTESLNRKNFHEIISTASNQSILFNNNLGSLIVYPHSTLAL